MQRSTSVLRWSPCPDPRAFALATLLLGACIDPSQGAPRAPASPIACRAGRGDPAGRDADSARELVEAARAAERGNLDRIFGGFARGDIAVYAGRITAHENLSAVGRPDERMAGPVIAGVHATSWGPTLFVVSASEDAVIELFASPVEPDAIASTGIIDARTGAGEAGRCRQCVTPFVNAPPRIVFPRAVLRGDYGTGQARVIEIDGALDRIAPEAVSLAHARRLILLWEPNDADALDGAVSDVGGLARDVRGSIDLPLRDDRGLSSPEHPVCRRVAEYAARWWIGAPRPAGYRVDDVCITRVVHRCCASLPETQAPCASPRAPSCVDREEP